MPNKWRKYGIPLILVIGLSMLLSCERHSSPLPEISPLISPTEGKTTTIFEFNLTETFNFDANQKLFVRWDWEGDGIFDTPYLHEKVLTHRYYSKGTFTPVAEILNEEGLSADSSFIIHVNQGYSNPRAKFTMSPASGNIHTPFIFDARLTTDDEDSLSSLLFRWDFEGDGLWDTQADSTYIVNHTYPEIGYYTPKLQVQDPTERFNTYEFTHWVSLLDTCIHPQFITIPEFLIQNEISVFDASASGYGCKEHEKLWYKWDFENDGFFDTEWLDIPTASHIFPLEFEYSVKLVVKNSSGLENSLVRKFWMNHQNQAPRADFRISSNGGNTQTIFRFDTWDCRDLEDSPTQMLARWDFDGDGNWDTDYDLEVEYFRNYDEPGEYRVALEITDRGGLKDTTYETIYINNNTNETAILLDKNGTRYEYYGTVKIGKQWWFAKNLTLYDSVNLGSRTYIWEYTDVGYYGYLYPARGSLYACPDGWKVPTKDDWDILFSNFKKEELYEQLILGGNSGFNAILGGKSNQKKDPPTFSSITKYGYYWSSTRPKEQTATSIWFITFDGRNRQVLNGYGPDYHYSVRCIKE